MFHQKRNVLFAIFERRQDNRNHVESIEQVLAKLAGLLLLLEPFVRRGDDADVGLPLLGAADAAIGPIFQDAQELGLHGGRHLGDFVDEQGAALGDLEQAGLCLRRPR